MGDNAGKSRSKAQAAIQALANILPSLPPALASSDAPATALLRDATVAAGIFSLLRRPESGAVNDNLCAWLYDTFHSSDPDLQLVVLRFFPTLAAVYLSRATALNKPLAGFESVLLAIYSHETAARNGQAITVTIPDLAHPSIYHDASSVAVTKMPPKSPIAASPATELHLGVISPSLEPHGTVRSTRRARIIAVGLELYYTKLSHMPVNSKVEFCRFCQAWSGQDTDNNKNNDEKGNGKVGGRVNLPWELLQSILRILGHCLLAPNSSKELVRAAEAASRSLNARALHDLSAKAILATGSLVKLADMAAKDEVDHTDIDRGNVITI